MDTNIPNSKIKIDIVRGVEGLCIYMDDYRIAGPKPWGGGQILKTYSVNKEIIETALKILPPAPRKGKG